MLNWFISTDEHHFSFIFNFLNHKCELRIYVLGHGCDGWSGREMVYVSLIKGWSWVKIVQMLLWILWREIRLVIRCVVYQHDTFFGVLRIHWLCCLKFPKLIFINNLTFTLILIKLYLWGATLYLRPHDFLYVSSSSIFISIFVRFLWDPTSTFIHKLCINLILTCLYWTL